MRELGDKHGEAFTSLHIASFVPFSHFLTHLCNECKVHSKTIIAETIILDFDIYNLKKHYI